MIHVERDIRALRALNLRRNGKKLDDIGTDLSVSRERARQLIKLGAEVERRIASPDPWDELSTRAQRALIADGCAPTLDGVMTGYEREIARYPEGSRYTPSFEGYLMRVTNVGKKTTKEIRDWLLRHMEKRP